MSIWSRCKGVAVLPKTSGFSIKKWILNSYDESIFHLYSTSEMSNSMVKVEFDFVFSLDGMPAATLVNQLVTELTSVPGYSYSQINTEIRFT